MLLGNRSSEADHYGALDAVTSVVRSIKNETCVDQRRFLDHLSLDVAMRNNRRGPGTRAEAPSGDRVPRLVISGCFALIRGHFCCARLRWELSALSIELDVFKLGGRTAYCLHTANC